MTVVNKIINTCEYRESSFQYGRLALRAAAYSQYKN